MTDDTPSEDVKNERPVPEGMTDEGALLGEIGPVGEDEQASSNALVPFDPLQRYLAEIRRYPLLSHEDEHELA